MVICHMDAIKKEASRLKALASAGSLVAKVMCDQDIAKRAKSLAPKAGAGAVEYLTGKTGAPIAAAIISGALPADEVITAEMVEKGVALAKEAFAQRFPPHFLR